MRALERLLCAAVAVRLGQGLARAGAPDEAARLPPPLVVDVSRDPAPRLRLLPGIGPRRAEAIERDRRENGPVGTLDELDRVPGIGPGTVRSVRETPRVRATAGAREPGER